MAPRKEKSEKASADEAPDMILKYLRKQNRPYSAADISANLHNKVSKAAAAKYLKEMHDRKDIEGRVSGKQTVYHALQNDPCEASSSSTNSETPQTQIADLTTKRDSLNAELSSLSSEVATLKRALAALSTSAPTRASLMTAITELAEEEDHLVAIIALIKGVDVGEVMDKRNAEVAAGESGGVVSADNARFDTTEVERVDHEIVQWRRIEAARSKIWRELRHVLYESLPLGVNFAEVAEELELDE